MWILVFYVRPFMLLFGLLGIPIAIYVSFKRQNLIVLLLIIFLSICSI
jgi:hypothetical protein